MHPNVINFKDISSIFINIIKFLRCFMSRARLVQIKHPPPSASDPPPTPSPATLKKYSRKSVKHNKIPKVGKPSISQTAFKAIEMKKTFMQVFIFIR